MPAPCYQTLSEPIKKNRTSDGLGFLLLNIVYRPLANKRKYCATAQSIIAPTLREHLAAAEATEIEYQILIKSFADRRAVARKRVA